MAVGVIFIFETFHKNNLCFIPKIIKTFISPPKVCVHASETLESLRKLQQGAKEASAAAADKDSGYEEDDETDNYRLEERRIFGRLQVGTDLVDTTILCSPFFPTKYLQ